MLNQIKTKIKNKIETSISNLKLVPISPIISSPFLLILHAPPTTSYHTITILSNYTISYKYSSVFFPEIDMFKIRNRTINNIQNDMKCTALQNAKRSKIEA